MRYRATVAYVGTFFHGWQIQENVSRTVQAALEEAAARAAGCPVRIHASGRTDAGVHAEGQVVHFDAPEREPGGLVSAINLRLPWDARVLEVAPTAESFHARSDAIAKRYVYRFSRERVIPPRRALFVAPISPRADPDRMARAARLLEGERDFFPFSTAGTETETTVRRLFSCSVSEAGPEIAVALTGDGFLRGMARAIAGTLADIARGRLEPAWIDAILSRRDKALVSTKARPRGLTLERVFYAGDAGEAGMEGPFGPGPAVR
jgi:tRNA pseudouridine38-40 synthase